ncbi:MAG TPA: hypothetical protein VG099_04165, partial [Gemmataceae bacterium]|nr:hypothetical protein [Gemmataceae bacterium]
HRFASCCTGLNSRITFVTQMTQISEGSGKLSVDFIGGLGGHVGAVGPAACVFALADAVVALVDKDATCANVGVLEVAVASHWRLPRLERARGRLP